MGKRKGVFDNKGGTFRVPPVRPGPPQVMSITALPASALAAPTGSTWLVMPASDCTRQITGIGAAHRSGLAFERLRHSPTPMNRRRIVVRLETAVERNFVRQQDGDGST